MLHAVIMAGGSGTRFWPASRRSYPKQLLSIGTHRPLVEETVDRISELIPPERTLIVTNAAYAGMTSELLSEVPARNVIGEPIGRDTAPCIGLAALILRSRDPDAIMAVMPADHVITPREVFCHSLNAAADFLKERKEALITFGIEPRFPATGYGYIKGGQELSSGKVSFLSVAAFKEKPDLSTARGFLEEGGYLWNAGIFLWRADTILNNMARFLPGLYRDLMQLEETIGTEKFVEELARIYPGLEKVSIDYGIMEKAAEHCCVASVDYAWDDVGSWMALGRLIDADESHNSVHGPCVQIDARDNIVSARGGMVGLINVEGLVVVHTPDATLVCKKEDAERVKQLVDLLEDEYR